MKAQVNIEKSFESEGYKYSKKYESGDFKEFFEGEGRYLDNLSDTLEKHGEQADTFTVVYTVTVKK